MSEGRPKRKAAAKARQTFKEDSDGGASDAKDKEIEAPPKKPRAAEAKKKAVAKPAAAPAEPAAAPVKSSGRGFVTHNEDKIDIDGTSLRGYIKATFGELCNAFGDPHEGDGFKTDAEWNIRFDDGVVATVYNWKNGPSYGGGSVKRIEDWNIGGKEANVEARVREVLEASKKNKLE